MRKYGFTLAEVLITLTVIGIVAAISIPALMQNVNERTWNAKRKALHSRMAAAISQIEDFSNFGTYSKDPDTNVVTDTVAESFLINGLSKVYKIKNICNSSNLTKCGLPEKFTNLSGGSVTLPTKMSELLHADTMKKFKDTNAAAFDTVNGEKIAVYYNPDCFPQNRSWGKVICANFIYDLNGQDEPNALGKDIGVMSVVYDTAQEPEVVAPNPYFKVLDTWGNPAATCKGIGAEYSPPSISEAVSIIFNYQLFMQTITRTGAITSAGSDGYERQVTDNTITTAKRSDNGKVVCVKE